MLAWRTAGGRAGTWLLATAIVGAWAASSARAAEDVGKPPVPPGQHPRLLFDRRGLGTIRRRAQTPVGQAMLNTLRHHAHGHRKAFVRMLATRDPKWFAEKRKQATRLLGKFSKHCWRAALIYVATGDAADGFIAVELFRLWMSGWPPNDRIEPKQSWGNPWLAMTYDWVYELLTPAERTRAQTIFGSMVGAPTMGMIGKDWWFGGPTPAQRHVTNWTAICSSSLGVTNLAIEGEPGYNPKLTPHCIAFLRGFLDGGLAPDGAMYEGSGYASGYGSKDVPYFALALRRRGVDLIRTTHMGRVPLWLTYEMRPWGYEGVALNQSAGIYGAGGFGTLIAQEFRGLARWVFKNSTGRTPAGCAIEPGIGLINGWPAYRNERPDKLPLCHWFSTRGLVYCRSGWGQRDAHFAFNTNPVGAGHTHADQGQFCLSSNGASFFTDAGVTLFPSQYHNVVMIDGKGQGQRQAGVDAFMRSVDTGAYADLIDADLKLAYDRRLQGESRGPWTWLEYNPVQKADRRALFVRGVTGPVVLVADDIRKDAKTRRYQWLGHVPANNPITVAGRRFQVRERFGGRFLQTIGRGAVSTLVAKDVRPGVVRGWALVRSVPHIAAWASNTIVVNGRKAPYNTSYFGLGHFYKGWRWMPILPDRKPDIKLSGGDLRVELHGVSGGRVALAVFSYRKEWQPVDDPPAPGKDFIVLGADAAVHAEGVKPWDVLTAPKGVLDGVFLGITPPELSVRPNAKARTRVLRALHQRPGTRYLAVMAPRDQGDAKTVTVPEAGRGEVAEIRSDAGVDIVAGAVDSERTTGRVVTDALGAVVSATKADQSKKRWRGYAMASGSVLSVAGQKLVEATPGRVHVVNDGKHLMVRGPGGTKVTCRRLGAVQLTCNGKTGRVSGKGDTVTVTIPVLPKQWTVAVSKDGRTVAVTGNGAQPLWIPAPKAVYVTVNGVQRWFVRDRKGNVCPALETGTPFRYDNQQDAPDLKAHLAAGSDATLADLRSFDPTGRQGAVLASAAGRIELDLAIPGPGVYKATVQVVGAGPVTASTTSATGKPVTADLAATADPGVRRLVLEDVTLRTSPVRVSVRSPKRVGVVAVTLMPDYRSLPATLWTTIGPVPSPYGPENGSSAAVKQAMETVHPPEKELKLDATYTGTDGRKVAWQHSDRTGGSWMNVGVNFSIRCGFKNVNVCYAVTFITSPDDRTAQVRIACDYWANLFVNGRKVRSERARTSVAEDGAEFKGDTRTAATIHLRKGVNVVLVKSQGGTGTNSFAFAITDPGDLRLSPRP